MDKKEEVKKSNELTELIIYENIERWQKEAKPYYNKDNFETLFGLEGLVVTLPANMTELEIPLSGKHVKSGIDTAIEILRKIQLGKVSEAKSLYTNYGRFDERMSYLETYISKSLYVPEMMDCLARDWELFIKHFPWQADESIAEFKQLKAAAKKVLEARREQGEEKTTMKLK